MTLAPLGQPDPPLRHARTAIILRPWRHADASALVEAWADLDIAAYCGVPADAGPERAAEWIDGWSRRLDRGLALDLVIADAPTDAVLGEVGLRPFPAPQGAAHDALELGWWMGASHRGAGRASQAVRLVADWAVRAHPGRRVLARIPPGHAASEAVARAAGLTRLGGLDPTHDLWARQARATVIV